MSFAVLAITFLASFGLINFYLLRRAWQALSGTGPVRVAVLVVFLVLLAALLFGRSLAMRRPGLVPEILSVAGAFYFAALIYFLLFTVLIDLARLVDHFVPYFPEAIRADPAAAARWAFGSVVALTGLLLAGGFFQAHRLRTTRLDIKIDKPAGGLASLNAVALSDVHVGPFLHRRRLEKIVEAVNRLDPDVVFIAGDIVNEDTPAIQLESMIRVFRRIRSRWGVFVCPGNHEYFAGIEKSLKVLEACGFRVLMDEAVLVADAFVVVGRTNRQYLANRERRKPLPEILAGTDRSWPILLLDHQPARLFEAAEASVDFQFSGHTHAGQIVPLVWINDLLWEIGRGYGRKGPTQVYVSHGVGVWGIPTRLGTRSEIVHLRVSFR
jgi:hypothetical protein